jgi:hypothetical protein|eukprot:g3613.t1
MLHWGDCIDSDSDEEYSNHPETVEIPAEVSADTAAVKSRAVTRNVSYASLLQSNDDPETVGTPAEVSVESTASTSRKVTGNISFASMLRGGSKSTPEPATMDQENVGASFRGDANAAVESTVSEPKQRSVQIKPETAEKQSAKVVQGISFLSKVLGATAEGAGAQLQTSPSATPRAASVPEGPLPAPKAKPAFNLSLDSSRDGLNLLFSQVVRAGNGALPSTPRQPVASLPKIAEETASPKAAKEVKPEPLNEKRIEKRQRQIDIGKMSVGYQHYTKAVPKNDRVVGVLRHPVTPNKLERVSKRNFDAKMKSWRRYLHLWDDPNVDPMKAGVPVGKSSPRTEVKKKIKEGGEKRKAAKTPLKGQRNAKSAKLSNGQITA